MAQITFTIPDEKVVEFVEAFLADLPCPEGMTTLQWIKYWGRSQYMAAYSRGKVKLIKNTAVIDDDILD